MTFALTRLSPLDGEAILPLAEAKEHLRVLHEDEDGLIRALRDAAIAHIENATGMALAPTEYRWVMPRFEMRLDLPVKPATELGAVEYWDADGEAQTVTGAVLRDGLVFPPAGAAWPAGYNRLAVTFTAGTATPPADLLAAVKLMLGHLYAHREAVNVGNIVSQMPFGVEALIQPYRRIAL